MSESVFVCNFVTWQFSCSSLGQKTWGVLWKQIYLHSISCLICLVFLIVRMIEWNLMFQFVHLVQISLRWKLCNDATLNIFSSVWFMTHPQSPEGLDDVRGDGGSSFVGVGLPRQRHAVLGHVRHYGFVRRTWQLEGLCGLGHRRVCALWTDRRRQKEGGEGVKKKTWKID